MRADIPGKGPIRFEEREIPAAAKYFDMLPCFDQLTEDTQKWVFDLKYAWARQRTSPSALVAGCLDELEDCILRRREEIYEHLRKVLPATKPDELLRDLLTAITIMRERAERNETCTWSIEPETGEVPYYLGVVTRIYRGMLESQNANLERHEQIPIPKILETISFQSENVQIAFINSVVDGLTDSEDAS